MRLRSPGKPSLSVLIYVRMPDLLRAAAADPSRLLGDSRPAVAAFRGCRTNRCSGFTADIHHALVSGPLRPAANTFLRSQTLLAMANHTQRSTQSSARKSVGPEQERGTI